MTGPDRLWWDDGPASQGKILTAILQRDHEGALAMVRQWSSPDLLSLEEAATRLSRMAGREIRSRERGFTQ